MKKKIQRQTGITLIALIITIIIMLILVAVSISVALNTGLFKSAGDATKNWKTAQDAESKMKIEIDGKTYNSAEDYLAGIPEIHNWVRTGDKLTCKHCDKSYTIGQQVSYTARGNETTTIAGEKSGVSQGIERGHLKAENFGENGEQTISKDTETTWVVLGIENSNGNDDTNETLLLTTQTPTTGVIRMYGEGAYNNCVEEINRMCKELYGEDARGMTIEDINECVNYKNPKAMYYANSKWYEAENKTTKLKELGEDYANLWNAITNFNMQKRAGKFYEPRHPTGIEDNGASLGEYELNGYYYSLSDDGTYLVSKANIEDTSKTITPVERDLIFGESKTYKYWLASRGVTAYSNYAYFGSGLVIEDDAFSNYGLFYTSGILMSTQLSLRCVVSIRAELPAIVEQNG